MILIIGLNGCYCHPFASWEECHKAERQKFRIGDRVKHRCSAVEGTVVEATDRQGFCIVCVGKCEKVSDRELHHVQQLILITKTPARVENK